MKSLHRSEFLRELKESFPALKDEVNSRDGLLHLEMHVFRDFVQRCIAGGDIEKVRRSFLIAERYCVGGNAAMKNAIGVSFVEHLDFQQAQWAWDLFGPTLKKVYLHFVDAGMAKPLPYHPRPRASE
jgi:hypothetical protein